MMDTELNPTVKVTNIQSVISFLPFAPKIIHSSRITALDCRLRAKITNMLKIIKKIYVIVHTGSGVYRGL